MLAFEFLVLTATRSGEVLDGAAELFDGAGLVFPSRSPPASGVDVKEVGHDPHRNSRVQLLD